MQPNQLYATSWFILFKVPVLTVAYMSKPVPFFLKDVVCIQGSKIAKDLWSDLRCSQ